MPRAPANDIANIYTPILAGGPLPLLFSIPCRFVAADQITFVDFPFNGCVGWITYDPPNTLNAAQQFVLGAGLLQLDYWVGNLVELSSIPGVFHYIQSIEEVQTDTDNYFRAELMPSTYF